MGWKFNASVFALLRRRQSGLGASGPRAQQGLQSTARRSWGLAWGAGLAATALGVGPATAWADPDDDGFRIGANPGRGWRMIGQAQAGRMADRYEIRVRADRAYTTLRLRVFHAPVEIMRLRIQFRNGQWREINVRQFIERGGSTRKIDLPGEGRFIERIVFWHKTPRGTSARANVQVWART